MYLNGDFDCLLVSFYCHYHCIILIVAPYSGFEAPPNNTASQKLHLWALCSMVIYYTY